jgi:hypothetical protein
MLVGGVLIVALLISLLVKGGWLIWLPAVPALYITVTAWNTPSRR